MNLTRNLEESLIIFDKGNHEVSNQQEHSQNFRLFKDLECIDLKSRKRWKRKNKESKIRAQVHTWKYPTHHLTIRKALQIPISSFQKLKKELDVNGLNRGENLYDGKKKNPWMTKRGFIFRVYLNLQPCQSQYKKFKESIKEKFETEKSWARIKKYIKEELKFSYKRGCSRPIAWKSQEHVYLQYIFSWRILREIRAETLLINVDESSYNIFTKRNYSWLPIGSSYPILNDKWIGRTSIIFGLVSNGDWLWST